MKKFVLFAVAFAAAGAFGAETQCPPRYAYCGWTGPQQWKNLPGATCGGASQSPVNVAGWKIRVGGPAITVNYGEIEAEVINSGHDIEVDPKSGTGSITIEGTTYELVQFHFHTPSEHHLQGKTFPAEMHFVHKNGDRIVVVAVLLAAGRASRVLAPLFANLPEKICTAKPAHLNLSALLPTKIESYYTYTGSLTTPPCTEGVTFYLANGTGITLSAAQVAKLRRLGPNARPIQEIGKREITLVKRPR